MGEPSKFGKIENFNEISWRWQWNPSIKADQFDRKTEKPKVTKRTARTCSGALSACEEGRHWKLAVDKFDQMRSRWFLEEPGAGKISHLFWLIVTRYREGSGCPPFNRLAGNMNIFFAGWDMWVRSGENLIFQLKNLVGSQNSPKMTNKNGKKRMLHNKSNSDMPTKKTQGDGRWTKHVFRGDWQKVYNFQVGIQLFLDTSSISVKALATSSSCLQSVDRSVQAWFGMVLMSGLLATYVQRWNFFAEFFHINGRWSFFNACEKHLKF